MAEHRLQQGVAREHLPALAEQEHRNVVQGRGHPEQPGIGSLHRRRRPSGPARRGREVAQVRGLGLVQAQRPRQRRQH
jgi:hypothetical protein